jgi:hypothetical protein
LIKCTCAAQKEGDCWLMPKSSPTYVYRFGFVLPSEQASELPSGEVVWFYAGGCSLLCRVGACA